MLKAIHPMLPMRNKSITRNFYVNQLGFEVLGDSDYSEYLMLKKDSIELHFFLDEGLKHLEHDGMCYIRTDNVDEWYQLAMEKELDIPDLGHLQVKPWSQKEFSVRDPDMNLLIFGESIGEGHSDHAAEG